MCYSCASKRQGLISFVVFAHFPPLQYVSPPSPFIREPLLRQHRTSPRLSTRHTHSDHKHFSRRLGPSADQRCSKRGRRGKSPSLPRERCDKTCRQLWPVMWARGRRRCHPCAKGRLPGALVSSASANLAGVVAVTVTAAPAPTVVVVRASSAVGRRTIGGDSVAVPMAGASGLV